MGKTGSMEPLTTTMGEKPNREAGWSGLAVAKAQTAAPVSRINTAVSRPDSLPLPRPRASLARGENLGPRVGVEELRAGVRVGVRSSGRGPAASLCCVGVGPPGWERAPLLVWRAGPAGFRSLFLSVRGTKLERRRGRFWCRVAALKERDRGPKGARRGRSLALSPTPA